MERLQKNPITTAAKFYAARLPLNDKAIAFAAEELQLTIEQASEFNIGFSDRRLGKNLPSRDGEAGRNIRALLQDVGLLKPTGHEALRGCITIPTYDNAGNVTGILGKRIDGKAKADNIVIGSVDVHSVPVAPESEAFPPPTIAGADLGEDGDNLTIEGNQTTFICDDRRYRVSCPSRHKVALSS